MKKQITLSVVLALALVFGLSFVSCEIKLPGNNPDDSPGNTPVNPPGNGVPPAPALALRAVPVAASSSAPKVLDSYTDGSKNFYLIDVGYIRNTYVSDVVAPVHYNGFMPMSLSKTTVTENTVAEALRNTVTTSVTVSDTQNHKVGIDVGWKKKFPFVGTFSVNLKYEWSGSWTNSSTNTRSSETSVTETKRYSESLSISFTIGNNGEPEGYYRYALYSTSDVYFVISTSLDNQELLSWDTVACVRDGSFLPHWDYDIEGNFDNSPTGNDITFTEDFYKTLPKPAVNPGFSVTNTDQWNDALTAIRNGGSGTAASLKTYDIVINGNVSVPGSSGFSTSLGYVQFVAVTLKGSGSLSLNSNGSILCLESSTQILIIDGENLALRGRNGNVNSLFYVWGGILVLNNGVITGNKTTGFGGGVYVLGGTFIMRGGNITGNTAYAGGGVYVQRSTFIKTGGTIYGYDSIDTVSSNVVRSDSGVVQSNRGHAVYAVEKRKEITAGPTVDLSFYGKESPATFSGAWDY